MSIIGEGLELLGLIDKAKNADLYRQLGDYIEKIRQQQIENDKLHTELGELKEQLRFKGELERIDGHTFVKGDDEEICPSCAAVSMRPVHLEPLYNPKPPFQRATCPACKTSYLHNVPVRRNHS